MPIVKPVEELSIDFYLAGEQSSEVRHEYIDGQVYAMVGASKRHNLIAVQLLNLLRANLIPPYHIYMSDVKVRVDDVFYYPDLLVACSDNQNNPYYETEPLLIIEVLSPSTEAKDRFEKRVVYQRLLSLQEYVLVAQEKMKIEIYRRVENGWIHITYVEHEQVELVLIKASLALNEIYL